jgi:hypothetical protein
LDNGDIVFQNIGNDLNRPIEVWGFLKNREGKIIWSGIYRTEEELRSQQMHTAKFGQFQKWQNHLACTATFYIAPSFNFFERSKLNNRYELEFGECEDVPDETNGDRIDFNPEVVFEDQTFRLRVLNNGRLPFLEATTKLETVIHFFNLDNEIIFSKNLFTEAPIHGFGSSKIIHDGPVPEGTCSIELELNPNITIKESNYENNRIKLNICE